ncbi:hypothetical protein LY78DRAFT_466680 [Colletotrichum sublineola]|nr:hypothetical protein LY78DRAFT_466680 [Colletotrichum sublineola]
MQCNAKGCVVKVDALFLFSPVGTTLDQINGMQSLDYDFIPWGPGDAVIKENNVITQTLCPQFLVFNRGGQNQSRGCFQDVKPNRPHVECFPRGENSRLLYVGTKKRANFLPFPSTE